MTDTTPGPARAGWTTGLHYFRRGLRVLGLSPGLYAEILVLFALPAVGAALLSISDYPQSFARSVLTVLLSGISSTVAPVMIMIPVAAGFHGRNLGLRRSLADGVRWFPRYYWTNVHTSVIFWAPVGSLVALYVWRSRVAALDGALEVIVSGLWILLIAVAGIYLHSRTLLAPFLAVHGNLPGTLAALEAWRLSGRYFPQVFGMFVVSSAPTAVPLSIAILGLWLGLASVPDARETLTVMLPSLVWVAIKIVRPFLVTATYGLYQDLWPIEQARREDEGHPATPAVARILLRVSWWVPRVAGFLVGRRVDWTI